MYRKFSAVILFAVLAVLFSAYPANAKTVYPAEIGDVLHNPHMGWVYYTKPSKWQDLEKAENLPTQEFDIVSLGIGWNELEPAEGQYQWSLLDQTIADLKALGKTIYIRLMLMGDQTLCWSIDGIPQWLWDNYNVPYVIIDDDPTENPLPTKHPYYWNQDFQAKALSFLQAFAAHYTADQVDYIDVRIYGNTGEWDAGNNPFPWENFPEVNKTSVLRDLVNIYHQAFINSDIKLAIDFPAWGTAIYPDYLQEVALDYAIAYGWSIRYDAFNPWGISPYVVSSIADYADSRFITGETGCGWCPDERDVADTVTKMLEAKVNHASFGFMRANYLDFITNYADQATRGLLNMGYRLVINQADFNDIATPGDNFTLNTVWQNKAVGRLYRQYALRAYLVNQYGKTLWAANDTNFDPTFFLHNQQHNCTSTFTLPTDIPGGFYDLKVALVDKDDNPAILLAIDSKDDSNRYTLGKICIASPYKSSQQNTVALFDFDENTGTTTYGDSTTAADVYELKFNLNDTPSAQWTTSVNQDFASALHFDGTYQHSGAYTTDAYENLALAQGGGTVEAWIKIDSYPQSSGGAVIAMTEAPQVAWQLKIDNLGRLSYAHKGNITGAWLGFTGDTPLSPGKWHHVAMSRQISPDQSTPGYGDMSINLYNNGELCATQNYQNTELPASGNVKLHVGYFSVNDSASLFTGSIDDLRIMDINRFDESSCSCQSGVFIPGDINGDCYVDHKDMITLLNNWLENN